MAVAFSPQSSHFVSLSKDRSLFLFRCLPDLTFEPILQFFIGAIPLCCDWRRDNTAILLGTSSGFVMEVDVTSASPPEDSYVTKLAQKSVQFVRPRKIAPQKPKAGDQASGSTDNAAVEQPQVDGTTAADVAVAQPDAAAGTDAA